MKIGIGVKMKNIISGKTFEEAEQALMKKRKKYLTQLENTRKLIDETDRELKVVADYIARAKKAASTHKPKSLDNPPF
jgi:hypothetical protein